MKLVHFVIAFIVVLVLYNTDYKIVTGEGFYTEQTLDSLTQQVGFLSLDDEPIDMNLINVIGGDSLTSKANVNVHYFYHIEMHALPFKEWVEAITKKLKHTENE